MAFRFPGTPMISEPMEFGHLAFPVYTTLRDAGFSAFGGLFIGGMVYAVHHWIGLFVVIITSVGFLALTQRLRKTMGNAWPWELTHRGIGMMDKRGYLGGARRCHAASPSKEHPKFLVGDDPAILAIRVHTQTVSPFGKFPKRTQSKSHIARDARLIQERPT